MLHKKLICSIPKLHQSNRVITPGDYGDCKIKKSQPHLLLSYVLLARTCRKATSKYFLSPCVFHISIAHVRSMGDALLTETLSIEIWVQLKRRSGSYYLSRLALITAEKTVCQVKNRFAA